MLYEHEKMVVLFVHCLHQIAKKKKKWGGAQNNLFTIAEKRPVLRRKEGKKKGWEGEGKKISISQSIIF